MKKVLILDTSVLCVWLEVPGMEDCGRSDDRWDKSRVNQRVELEKKAGTTLVFPLASIIETGNHIAHAKHRRRECALKLAALIRQSAERTSPWAAFSEQSELWSKNKLIELAEEWPKLAEQKLALGDATIKRVAEYYASLNCRVEILTGDAGLKAYEPVVEVNMPRRRQTR